MGTFTGIMSGIAVGPNKGHVVQKNNLKTRNVRKKGAITKKVKFVREIVRDVMGYTPYERRIMELLKVSRDKRALKFAKNRLGTHKRGKAKRAEMGDALQGCVSRRSKRAAVDTTGVHFVPRCEQ